MWNPIPIPEPPARIRAYTHANNSILFICTNRGVFALNLTAHSTWNFIADRVVEYMLYLDELVRYDESGGITFREVYSPFHGYPSDGSDGCSDIPLGEHSLTGDRLTYDDQTDVLTVTDGSNPEETKLVVENFGAFDGNWATAGFSNDGKHLTVGNLDRILVFEFREEKV